MKTIIFKIIQFFIAAFILLIVSAQNMMGKETESKPFAINDDDCFVIIVHNHNDTISFSYHVSDTTGYLKQPTDQGMKEYVVYTNQKYIKFICDTLNQRQINFGQLNNKDENNLKVKLTKVDYYTSLSGTENKRIFAEVNKLARIGLPIAPNKHKLDTIDGIYYKTEIPKDSNGVLLIGSKIGNELSCYKFFVKQGKKRNSCSIEVLYDSIANNLEYSNQNKEESVKINAISFLCIDFIQPEFGIIQSVTLNGQPISRIEGSESSKKQKYSIPKEHLCIGENTIDIKYSEPTSDFGNPFKSVNKEFHFKYKYQNDNLNAESQKYIIIAIVALILLGTILHRKKFKSRDAKSDSETESSQIFKYYDNQHILQYISQIISTDTKDFDSDFKKIIQKEGAKQAIEIWNKRRNNDRYISDYDMDNFIDYIIERDNQIQELEMAIKSEVEHLRQTVLDSNNIIDENKNEINRINKELESKESEITTSRITINNLNVTNIQQQNTIKEKDKTIAEHLNKIDEQQNIINNKTVIIESLTQEITSHKTVLIDNIYKTLMEIDVLLQNILGSVERVTHENTQYVNAIKNIINSFSKFHNEIKLTLPAFENQSTQSNEIIPKIQEFAREGLEHSGWINIISYINLYIGCTPELNTTFETNGIKSAEFARLTAIVYKFLGYIGITIYLPHLLVENYDSKYYDFENADQWIQTFATNLIPSDFSGKIFDMSQIGYQIADEINKPKVFTC